MKDNSQSEFCESKCKCKTYINADSEIGIDRPYHYYGISSCKNTTVSLDDKQVFSQSEESCERIIHIKLKSYYPLVISSFAKYFWLSEIIVIKSIVLFAYNIITGETEIITLSLSEVKTTKKNLNLAKMFFFSILKTPNFGYICLVILYNQSFIIRIKEKNNKLTYEILYKDKKEESRLLFLGYQTNETETIFYVISKPENTFISLKCIYGVLSDNIHVNVNNGIYPESLYKFDRFTYTTCKWTIFTEKQSKTTIIFDKNKLKPYTLSCKTDLSNQTYHLICNNDDLHLLTDSISKDMISIHQYQLDYFQEAFSSVLVEVYKIQCNHYGKHLFNTINDQCFCVNLYDHFFLYYLNQKNKLFEYVHNFQVGSICHLTKTFNIDTYLVENKTHVILGTCKEQYLNFFDFELKDKDCFISSNIKDNDSAISQPIESKANNTFIMKNGNNSLGLMEIRLLKDSEREPSSSSNITRLESKHRNSSNLELNFKEAKNDQENRLLASIEKHKEKSEDDFARLIGKQVDNIIDKKIESISKNILNKYSIMLETLEKQKKELDDKQLKNDETIENIFNEVFSKDTKKETVNDNVQVQSMTEKKAKELFEQKQAKNIISKTDSFSTRNAYQQQEIDNKISSMNNFGYFSNNVMSKQIQNSIIGNIAQKGQFQIKGQPIPPTGQSSPNNQIPQMPNFQQIPQIGQIPQGVFFPQNPQFTKTVSNPHINQSSQVSPNSQNPQIPQNPQMLQMNQTMMMCYHTLNSYNLYNNILTSIMNSHLIQAMFPQQLQQQTQNQNQQRNQQQSTPLNLMQQFQQQQQQVQQQMPSNLNPSPQYKIPQMIIHQHESITYIPKKKKLNQSLSINNFNFIIERKSTNIKKITNQDERTHTPSYTESGNVSNSQINSNEKEINDVEVIYEKKLMELRNIQFERSNEDNDGFIEIKGKKKGNNTNNSQKIVNNKTFKKRK